MMITRRSQPKMLEEVNHNGHEDLYYQVHRAAAEEGKEAAHIIGDVDDDSEDEDDDVHDEDDDEGG